MTILELLILLLIAGICGAIGEAIGGYAGGGFLVSIVVGFIGALFGVYIARAMGLPEIFAISLGGVTFPIIWSVIGAALFMAIIHLIARPVRVVRT